MSDSRTVLPTPKLLDLTGIRADASGITLSAKTSAHTARCPVCRKRSGKSHSRYTRILADLPWQGVPVTVRLHVRRFFCDEGDYDRVIFAERSSWSVCRASLRTTDAEPRTSRRLAHARLLRPRRGSRLSPSERPRGRRLRRHPVEPHPLDAVSESPDAEGPERGRLRFP